MSLQGRKALVTGSSRGIGRAILLALADAGAEVIVHCIEESDAAREALRMVGERGGKARFLAGDLAKPWGGRRLAEAALRECETIDILVLNASIQIRRAWDEISTEEYEMQMRVNFQASLEMIQVLAGPMSQQKWGRILTIGSVQEAAPHPAMAVYAASKAAQSNLVINLARQFAPMGITVNNLAPGVILTDRNTEALGNQTYAGKILAGIPCGFFGEPDDCTGAALLLCSDAGRYITGQSLYADGGMSL